MLETDGMVMVFLMENRGSRRVEWNDPPGRLVIEKTGEKKPEFYFGLVGNSC